MPDNFELAELKRLADAAERQNVIDMIRAGMIQDNQHSRAMIGDLIRLSLAAVKKQADRPIIQ